MSIPLLKDVVAEVPSDMPLIGIDVGKKTLGLALSTPDQNLATPLLTIRRTKFMKDMATLKEIVEEYEIGGFVIGLPVHMDGREGRRAQSVRDFAIEMKQVFGSGTFVALWDERLSTASVEDVVDDLVDKRQTKIKAKESGLIDKLAAQVILQGALDFISQNA